MTRLAAIALLLTASALSAADWPQFLGPNRDNSTVDKVAPWEGTLKAAWKKPVGPAHSSPVVAGGVVYAFYQPKGKNADALAAFDAATGEMKWEKTYDRAEFSPPFGAGPRGTPVVDGGQVFTLGGTGVLACWDAKTGDVVWKVDTLKDFQAENLTFGISGSPLVFGGKVYVNVGAKAAGVVAFDRKTGKTAWRATDDGASYSSPIVAKVGDKSQVVFLTKNTLIGFGPDKGEVFWKVPFRDLLSESATCPLAVGDTLIGSSVTLGSVALKVGEKDGKPAVSELWKNKALNCYFSTPVAVGADHLYMLNGTLSINPTITLRCVETKSGKALWEKPNIGKYHAALVRTGDDKLLMLDDGGNLSLIEPDPKGFKQLAKSKVCGATWAHPALVGTRVYLRDEKDLICVELK